MSRRVSSPAYVGRTTELGMLQEALDAAASESPSMFLVGGEAGIGKTRLAHEFMNRAKRAGARTLIGGCIPLAEGQLPYAPVHEALSTLEREVTEATLNEILAGTRSEFAWFAPQLSLGTENIAAEGFDPRAGQNRLFEHLLVLLSRLADSSPVVFVFEDLHWSDPSTLDLLSYLVRNLRRERVVLLCTYRTELTRTNPLGPWLAENLRCSRVQRLELSRFDKAEATAQITGICGAVPAPELIDEIFERSAGNPFFIEELLAARDVQRDALPPAVQQITSVRIASLSQRAQEVVRIAAVGRRRVTGRLLCIVAQMAESTLYEALHEAVDEYILVSDFEQDSFTFRHPLVQETVYAELLPAERARLHARFARALAAHPESSQGDKASAAAELSHHWYRANEFRSALRWAVRAGIAAEEVYGFADARLHYARALDLWARVADATEVAGMDRAGVLERAAQSAHLMGRDDTAISYVTEALEAVDRDAEPVRAALLYERLGWYHFTRWRGPPAFDAFRRALELIPRDPPAAERVAVLNAWGGCGCLSGRLRESHELCREALVLARHMGDRREEGRALQTLGYVHAQLGDFEAAVRELREAVLIATEVRDLDTLARAYASLAYAVALAGGHDESLNLALEGLEAACRIGLERQYGSVLRYLAGHALFCLGRWPEAAEILNEASGPGMGEVGCILVASALSVAQGDFKTARERLRQGRPFLDSGFRALWRAGLLETTAELALWEERLDDARDAVRDGLQVLAGTDEEAFTARLFWLGIRAEADRAQSARAYNSDRDIASAREVAASLLQQAATFRPNPLNPSESPLPEVGALVATIAGERSRLQGRPDPEAWSTAARQWEHLGHPYPATYARWREAEACLVTRAARDRAKTALRRAYETAARLSAAPLLAEIERLARSARIRLDEGRAVRHATESHAEALGLTPRERQVLSLLMGRRSNAEIARDLYITPKTVSVHLSHIYDKLGVNSRGAAVEVARSRGFVPDAAPGNGNS